MSRLRGHKELGGTQLGQLTLTDQRDIPDLMTSCSAYKAGGEKKKEGTFRVMVLFPQVAVACDNPASLEITEHLPASGQQ